MGGAEPLAEGADDEVAGGVGVGCRSALTVGVEQDPGLVAVVQLGSQLEAERRRVAVEAAAEVGGAGRDLDAGDGRGHGRPSIGSRGAKTKRPAGLAGRFG